MAKNIEIQINNGSNSYEILYPKVDLTNNQGTSLPLSSTSGILSIDKGGTNSSSESNAIYNLTQPLGIRTASQINSYNTSTYIPCYYSNVGYKFPINNIMTYINNNISIPGNGVEVVSWTGTGNNMTSVTLNFPIIQNKIVDYCMLSSSVLYDFDSSTTQRGKSHLVITTGIVNLQGIWYDSKSDFNYNIQNVGIRMVYEQGTSTNYPFGPTPQLFWSNVEKSNNGFTFTISEYFNVLGYSYLAVLYFH